MTHMGSTETVGRAHHIDNPGIENLAMTGISRAPAAYGAALAVELPERGKPSAHRQMALGA
jgi:hypothetical protein